MEYGSRLRFALVTIGAIILLILSIWGITSIARNLLGGNKSTSSTVKQINLDDYTNSGSAFSYTAQGPIVADENFQSYQITVTQNYRELKIFKGYNKTLVSNQHFGNNNEAYTNFIKALAHANFTSKNKNSEDEKGACASGDRFIYQMTSDNQDVVRSWGSTCGGSGNYTGLGGATRLLFKAQIPDINNLTQDFSF